MTKKSPAKRPGGVIKPPMEPKKLTPKEEAFAAGVAAGATRAAAYRAAFANANKWKDNTVWTKASALHARSEVQERIEEIRGKTLANYEVTVDRIIAETAKIAFGSMRDVAKWGEKGLTLMESGELTSEAAACVSEISEKPGMFGTALKIKRHDKLGALRLLAEMKGALVRKSEITGANGTPLVPEAAGVLVVPGVMSETDWEAMMEKANAQG